MIGGTSLPKRERARVGVTTRRATRSSAAKDAEAQQEAEDISQQAEQPHPGQWAGILPTEDASQVCSLPLTNSGGGPVTS